MALIWETPHFFLLLLHLRNIAKENLLLFFRNHIRIQKHKKCILKGRDFQSPFYNQNHDVS